MVEAADDLILCFSRTLPIEHYLISVVASL